MVSVRGTASTINNQTPHLITRHSQAPLFRIRIAPGGCEEIQSQPLGIIRGHSGDAQESRYPTTPFSNFACFASNEDPNLMGRVRRLQTRRAPPIISLVMLRGVEYVALYQSFHIYIPQPIILLC